MNRVSILAAVFALAMNQWIQGFYGGFAYSSSEICSYTYSLLTAGGERFWWSHTDPYYVLNSYHFFLFWVLLLFILVRLFEKGPILQVIGIVPLAGATWTWFLMERARGAYLRDPEKYMDPLRELSPYTTVLLVSISVLIVLQLISLGSSVYFARKARLA